MELNPPFKDLSSAKTLHREQKQLENLKKKMNYTRVNILRGKSILAQKYHRISTGIRTTQLSSGHRNISSLFVHLF